MPRTMEEGFRDFHAKLTPSIYESEAAKNHRASIKACLERSFRLQSFFRTGSFGNGTSISGYSDVDYFARIPRENLKQNSGITLTQVREVLDRRFPRTGVHIDCPAVVCPFGTDATESTEITPADCVERTKAGHLVYEIPDCSGGWMLSSPAVHNAYVREVDQKLGGKVKPLIRFIKAWKYYLNVPISSFYLELRVTKYAEGESSIIYDIDVARIFSLLHRIGLSKMQDPMGISGYINACSTQVKLNDAFSKLSTALSRVEKAIAAKNKGDTCSAFSWWNLVYNGNFPNYYR